jgi:rhodanese-related sulfurtransferase
MPRRISPQDLIPFCGSERLPRLVDVRREAAARESGLRIAGSIWRHHRQAKDWWRDVADGPVVVYCAHGHNVSEIAAAELRALGIDAAILDGGLNGWREAGGPCVRLQAPGVDLMAGPTVWVTRQRPKVDRVACPWLIRRFIDPGAVVHFVSAEWVRDVAEEIGAVPFDVEGVHYSHRGEECSFDTFLDEFGLEDEALRALALLVRGADTARFDLAPQAAGLAALSFGLSAIESDDLEQLRKGMILYDALYGWCRHARDETHNWPARSRP